MKDQRDVKTRKHGHKNVPSNPYSAEPPSTPGEHRRLDAVNRAIEAAEKNVEEARDAFDRHRIHLSQCEGSLAALNTLRETIQLQARIKTKE